MIPSRSVVRAAYRLLRIVPVPVVRGLANVAGTVAYAIQTERRRTLLENLSHTAPNETIARRRRLARRTFRNLATSAVDLFRLPSASREEVLSLVEMRGLEYIDQALAMGKGVLVVTGHVGAYELGGVWLAARGYPVHAMIEDLEPKLLETLATYRQATGMQLVSMKQGIRQVYRLLEQQQIVILVADRAIGDGRGAVEVPFCDGIRPVPTGPATFAMATGAPLIVGHVSLNPARQPRYLVKLDPPLLPNGRGDEERLRLTRWVSDRLAAAVRDHPDEWYVFQPQWITRDV
jgi:KDO2-lipid IV(A) lauroyltransferase